MFSSDGVTKTEDGSGIVIEEAEVVDCDGKISTLPLPPASITHNRVVFFFIAWIYLIMFSAT